jgi:hypothetical protein
LLNFLMLLVGGMAADRMLDYPAEIRDLRRQLPKAERGEIISDYKKLPANAKVDFKAALRNADLDTASKILGEDLTKYNIVLHKTDAPEKPADPNMPYSGTDIVAKVQKLISVPTSVDPEYYAEAARRYEEAVPANSNMSITEKAQKLINYNA